MSNTSAAVQQNLCRSFVLENLSNTHPLISSSLPCKIPFHSKNDRAFLHNQRLRFSTRFLDNSPRNWKTKFPQKMRRAAYMVPHAVLATDSFPKLRGKFKLDENSELQIALSSKSDSLLQIDFQITNGGESLVLHWGAVRSRNKDWSLPSFRPDRTKVYKNEALRTPFVKSGSSSFVKLEIDDPEVQAIEFLIVDEAQNKWFKNDGHNFHIQLSGNSPQIIGASIAETINVTIPEDLVEIYAYLRWEKKGRQTCTPEQEKGSWTAELQKGLVKL